MPDLVRQAKIKEAPGYEIHYCPDWEIPGLVWSSYSHKYLKLSKSKKRYYSVALNHYGTFMIPRLLIQYFRPEIWDPDLFATYKDGETSNITLENLEMVSWVSSGFLIATNIGGSWTSKCTH